jgi:hypothetical protein
MARDVPWLADELLRALGLPDGLARLCLITRREEDDMAEVNLPEDSPHPGGKIRISTTGHAEIIGSMTPEELRGWLPPLASGLWRHWRGHLYQVLGYARSTAREEPGQQQYREVTAVVYVGLELDGAQEGPRMMFRVAVSDDPRVEAWWDHVHADGSKCLHERAEFVTVCRDASGLTRAVQPRFEYAGIRYLPGGHDDH